MSLASARFLFYTLNTTYEADVTYKVSYHFTYIIIINSLKTSTVGQRPRPGKDLPLPFISAARKKYVFNKRGLFKNKLRLTIFN